MTECVAYRSSIFYFKDSADFNNLLQLKKNTSASNQHYVYIEDGILIVENGIIKKVGNYSDLKKELIDIKIIEHPQKLITPGFIDTHQHSTQSGIVAAYGEKLLEWLHDYVFPGESSFSDEKIARSELNFFLDELLRNGTTTAVSYGPLFRNAANIFFEELDKRKMRFITGNILMDTNSPDNLRLSTEENYAIAEELIKKWHNKGRLSYCISPRFALACSEEMLELCGSLKRANPELYIQTHVDENLSEIEQVKKAFPWSKNYMDVYDHFGLITDKTVLGHCVHVTEDELELFKRSGAIISTCPLSNNFLGSGLFNFAKTAQYTHKITLGSDWGGGDSLSMFAVMDDVYKVSMLNSYKIPTLLRWYLCTLGAAKSLQLEDKIGNFAPGKEADFIVIDPYATPYLQYRLKKTDDILDFLFVLMTVADDRNIYATYIFGEPAYVSHPTTA